MVPTHRFFGFAFSAIAALCGLRPLVGGADIILDRNAKITITEDGDFDTAAGLLSDLLERYLLLALGKEDTDGSVEIRFVIRTRACRWQDLPRDSLSRVSDIDAFEIAYSDEPEATVTITGQTPTATGYAVMHFLEKYLGVFWAFPGDLGVCLPKNQWIHLEEGREQVSPWVVSRALSGMVFRAQNQPWPRNRERSGVLVEQRYFFLADDYFKSLRFHPGTVHHHMVAIFPVERSVKENPEVLPILPDGSRFIPQPKTRSAIGGKNAYQAWHPCYTNPRTLEIAIQRGRQEFGDGHLFYSLGINDGQRVQCQCAECRRVGWPHSYYQFVTHVADALRDAYPPQMVGVLAYGDVGIPPADLNLPDNVLVNVAGNRKMVWQSLAPAMGTYDSVAADTASVATTMNVQLYLLWRPDTPSSTLGGEVLFRQIRD